MHIPPCLVRRGPRPALMLALLLPAAAAAQQPALAPLHLVTPMPLERAVQRGTRSANGAPGPRYWQNSADYWITVRVSPMDSLLQGDETVIYHNASPDALRQVVFRLYQNLMGPEAARESPRAWHTDGMVIDALQVDGRDVPVPSNDVGQRPDSTWAEVRGTLMTVPLPLPLATGDSARFRIRWHFTIPPLGAPRMRMEDASTAQIAQWYPQIAVYDDVHGWDMQQYTGTGEFYCDYGHFRYSVTLPAGYVVAGTGTLQDVDSVLTSAEQAALARARPDSIVHVLTAADFGPGHATRGAVGTLLTWRFDADSVRDVAFAFSDHYLWDATRAVVDSVHGTTAAVNVLYRIGRGLYPDVAAISRSALETHSSRMVPYPYPQLTVSEGGSGGMEYPMIVFVGAYTDLYRMDEVTAHEIGHEWFPMMVGSNETRYGWQDEGLNTFDTFFATDAFMPDSMRGYGLREAQRGYLDFIRDNDEDLIMMSPANSFGVVDAGYSPEAYDKPSSTLWVLRSILGDQLFTRAYRTYIRRWAYKHPTPWDFFWTFNDVTGRDLDAFWQPWFFTRKRLDQAITGVEQQNGHVLVTVKNLGGLYAPVDVTARLADGSTVHWREPMTSWYTGRDTVRTSAAVNGQVVEVTLDAAGDFPDVDRGNNVWKAAATGG
jgi:Peptidase family M1 domain